MRSVSVAINCHPCGFQQSGLKRNDSTAGPGPDTYPALDPDGYPAAHAGYPNSNAQALVKIDLTGIVEITGMLGVRKALRVRRCQCTRLMQGGRPPRADPRVRR